LEKIIATILVVFISFSTIAQNDSLQLENKKDFHRSLILPAGLAVASILLNKTSTKVNLQNEILSNVEKGFQTKADEFTQYAPIAQVYIAAILKIPAKNNWKIQTKNLFFSQVFTTAVVLTLKKSFNITRPDGTPESFPSGHTSRAFVSSQVLYQEFKDSNKLLAYSGYLFSTSTGVLRVLNNRHWVPDVLLAAGLGIGLTNLVYYINPLKNWKMFQEKETEIGLRVIPIYNGNFAGANFSYRF
jgi:membrane-associated phospholipid phosphatase